MKIPVFLSAPTSLSDKQERSREIIVQELLKLQFEPRALGRSDYPADLPIREVYSLASHCAGGVILGFSQFETNSGIWKKGTEVEKEQTEKLVFPTPWNHLESGILFGLEVPLLVFREVGISGGIFDPGVADVFIQNMPIAPLTPENTDAISQVFLKWSAKVREKYYRKKGN
jgi:hypothetical protein